MLCKQCEKPVKGDSKVLNCIECSGCFHLSCLSSISENEYSFLAGANNWKCDLCVKNKSVKHDETPITPVRQQRLLKDSEGDSDSSNTSTANTQVKVVCGTCAKGFSRNAHRARCVKCDQVFHFKPECVIISKEEYTKVQSTWLCCVCTGKGAVVSKPTDKISGLPTDKIMHDPRSVMTPPTAGLPGGDKIMEEVTLAAIMNEMKAFRIEVNKTYRGLEENMNRYSEWVMEQGKKIDEVAKQMTGLCSDVAEIRQENLNLKKQVLTLFSKIENLEQAAKENVIEIQGVPQVKQEDLLDTVSKIATAIGFEFNDSMVDNVYRYKTNVNQQPGGIVVKFVRKLDLQSFVSKRRAKRNLNTRDIGIMSGEAAPIYVNFSLTKEKRNLMKAARKVKQEKHYTFLWVNNGRIFMRKDPDSGKAVLIQCMEDLDRLQ